MITLMHKLIFFVPTGQKGANKYNNIAFKKISKCKILYVPLWKPMQQVFNTFYHG